MTMTRFGWWLFMANGVVFLVMSHIGDDPVDPVLRWIDSTINMAIGWMALVSFGFAGVFIALRELAEKVAPTAPAKDVIMDRLRSHFFDEWPNIILENDRGWWWQVIRDLDRMDDLSVDNVQERLDGLAAGVPHRIDWTKIKRSVA